MARGDLAAATEAFTAAVKHDPRLSEAHANLGHARRRLSAVDEADGHYRRALVADPGNAGAYANLLLNLFSRDSASPEEILAEHRRWAEHYARPPSGSDHANDPDPERRLRIGYVSRDFRDHSVAFFIEPVLTAHDRARVEVTCYADETFADAVTDRMRGLADLWRVTTGLDDEAVAAMVRDDMIDVLVDLGGHTQDARPLLFADKAAPVQVTWLGYPGTTGLSTIDYRLTDAIADPPGFEGQYSEALVRLDPCFLCYRAFPEAPEVAPPPVLTKGYVTFGSMNNLTKVTPAVVALWSRLLEAVPGSRMLVKTWLFTDETSQRLLREAFAANGIAPERIDIRTFIPDRAGHLALYGEIDVALDTFPYNGTTTTCEALWMGVPVVTLAGDRHAARVGASLLSAIGLRELIAEDGDAYVAVAIALAEDRDRLAGLRAGMRERMRGSPLMDAPAFTRRLEAAYRAMWRRWCESGRSVAAVP